MSKVNEVIKALRNIVIALENGSDGVCFDIAGDCKNAVELLKRSETDKQILVNDIALKDKEIERLKASQAVNHKDYTETDTGTIKTAYDNNSEPCYIEAEGSEAKHIVELLQEEAEKALEVGKDG